MDVLGAFIAKHCVLAPEACSQSAALYETYRGWANQAGEKTLSQRAFGLALAERGFQPSRQGKERERAWLGIGLAGQEMIPF